MMVSTTSLTIILTTSVHEDGLVLALIVESVSLLFTRLFSQRFTWTCPFIFMHLLLQCEILKQCHFDILIILANILDNIFRNGNLFS